MPTYEYECEKCGNKFDAFQSIKADPLTECPACKGNVRRLISTGAGIIFSAKSRSAFGGKGPGFYATDYKNKKREEKPCPANNKDNPSCRSCPMKE